MNWLRRFMSGRSGNDQLSIFLLVLSVILTWTGRLTHVSLLVMLSYAALFMGIFRVLSKDISRRRDENRRFMKMIQPVTEHVKNFRNRHKKAKTHLYFRCPSCRKMLRVPKGKGKIRVTCPYCKNKTIRDTKG